jgi:hypothetical protein
MRRAFLTAGVLAIAAGVATVLLRSGGPSDALEYQGHWIPFSQLRLVDPHPGCEVPHYHAREGDHVTATDGTMLPDSTDCGFGPVS